MKTKQNEAQHTPTPWAVYHWHPGARDIAYIAPAGLDDSFFRADEIAALYKTTPGESSDADKNAEFIVRAVNSHAALVEALEAAQRTLRAVIAAHEAEPFRAHLDPAQRFQNDLRNTAGLVIAALAGAKGTK